MQDFSTLGIYYLFNIREMIISDIFSHIYWTPGCNWNGSMKLGLSVLLSVCPLCPSVVLSGRFLGNGSLVSSKCKNGVRNSFQVESDSQIFSKKLPKNGEMCPKWAKKSFFRYIVKFGQ